MNIKLSVLGFWLAALAACEGAAGWNQFRGENGQGVSANDKPPIHLDREESLLWQIELPPGHSSPVMAGDLIFLTSFSEGKLSTLAVSKSGRRIEWKKEIPAEKIEKHHSFGSPAAPSCVTDGKRVISYFGSFGLAAYDLAGKELWQKPLPMSANHYGTATSPVIVDGKLILARDTDGGDSFIEAMDPASGASLWKKSRPMNRAGWSTPVVWETEGGKQIVIAGFGRLSGYSLEGEEVWSKGGISIEHITMPVVEKGRLILASAAIGGGSEDRKPLPTWAEMLKSYDKNGNGKIEKEEAPKDASFVIRPQLPEKTNGRDLSLTFLFNISDRNQDDALTEEEWAGTTQFMAASRDTVFSLRPGGKGELGDADVAWKASRGVPEIPSPLLYQGRLYMVKNGGMLTSYNAETGQIILDRERLGLTGQFCASPVAANGHIYIVAENGAIVVLKAGDTLEIVSRRLLSERVTATPAIADDCLYIRTEKRLFCFGQKP